MQAVEQFLSAIWSAMLSALVALGLAAPASEAGHQGYVEAEFVLVAPTGGGPLESLAVRRGDRVEAGAALYRLDRTVERAALERVEARLAKARHALADLSKGKRQPEVEMIRAQQEQAGADLRLAEAQLQRQRRLTGSTAFSPEQLDQAQATYDLRRAKLEELKAAMATAKQSLGRADELGAAEAEVAAGEAELTEARWRLDQRAPTAPVAGLVFDTFFRPGEWVAAGQPVVSLLPPENLKVRFFVPQAALAAFPVGQAVTVACDGCPEPIPARVSFVSPEAEFTPPVLYNRDNRNRLVFMIEALPTATPALLRPGQPVDVVRAVP